MAARKLQPAEADARAEVHMKSDPTKIDSRKLKPEKVQHGTIRARC